MGKASRWLFLFCFAALLVAGCSNSETSADKKDSSVANTTSTDNTKPSEKDENNKIEKINNEPIELSSYAKEIDATLTKPESQKFSVESSFILTGNIKKTSQLKNRFVWIEMTGPEGGTFDYYLPIEDGKFHKRIKLFEGKGEYDIIIRLPNKGVKNNFYEMTTLSVTNKSSNITRDIFVMRTGLKNGLHVEQPTDDFSKTDGFLQLNGTVDEKYNGKSLMIKGEKGSETWNTLIPVENGTFGTEFPLHYGKGKHEVTVMLPDPTKDNYYLEAASLITENTSSAKTKPIKFYRDYSEKEFQLTYPKTSGQKTDDSFRIAGTYDPKVSENSKINQLIVTTKKGDLEASYLIPAENGTFDGEFWLRFGPGEYEVTVNIPEDPGAYQSYFRFSGIATFTVNSNAKDRRELLPSRGIQSNSPKIEDISAELTDGKTSARKKAKAIYEYVAKKVTYDVEKLEKDLFKLDDSALKTLKEESGVCQDYAFLTIALLRAADIESHYISGYANGGRHAWVEANIDGNWLLMDPTWGAGYVEDGKFVPHYNDKYFDPNLSEFKKTHNRDEIMY